MNANAVRLQGEVVIMTHPYPYAEGERCRLCASPATHKVEEQTEDPRHPYSAYLCCAHFGQVMGRAAVAACGFFRDMKEYLAEEAKPS